MRTLGILGSTEENVAKDLSTVGDKTRAVWMFQWLKDRGGVEAIAAVNELKSRKLYAAIDASGFYSNPVAEDCRSRMNVPFILADDKLDATFLEESAAAGLANLKGHRSVGGCRASIWGISRGRPSMVST